MPRKVHRSIKKQNRPKKPCRQCGGDFQPMSKWNVYCGECQYKIFSMTPNQRLGRAEL